METLFGIRSNIAIIAIGLVYLIISLNTTVNVMKTYPEFLSPEHSPSKYLFINTETNLFRVVSLILSVCCLFSSILLILGILEKRYDILRPWIDFTTVLEWIFITFSLYFIYLVIKSYESSWLNVCGLLLALFINLMSLAFHEYTRSGTYSLYRKFEKDSRRLYPVFDSVANEGIAVV